MLYVTGITGHSGKWFLRRLELERYQGKIRCVMRSSQEGAPEKYKLFDKCSLDIEFVVGSIEEENFLIDSMTGADTVVHIAGITHSLKIVDAALRNQVGWVILVHTTGRFSKYKSASEVYINIEDEIIDKKVFSENGERILNYTVLRPTMIYGSSGDRNMYRLIGYLKKHRVFPLFGDGQNLMQPVHARDLGNAYFDVLMNPDKTMNKEYDLSGKSPITYLNIIKIIRSYLGSNINIIHLPISLSIFAAKVYNALFKNAIITVEQVMRMQEDKAFSHKEAAHDFGYDPVSFEEGIKEEVEEYLSGFRVDYSHIKY
jgi:nucleoside-diphosphate-sugar epimerase